MKINCDLGEGLDQVDTELMPWIDMANIACGGHVGNRQSMERTVRLAVKHQVSIGAHPSYPDKDNFGRKSLAIGLDRLARAVAEQVRSLQEICVAENTRLSYIKPHGALYHDLLMDQKLYSLILSIAKDFNVPLMLQAMPTSRTYWQKGEVQSVNLLREGFADRRYTDEGHLVSRQYPHALLTEMDEVMAQAYNFKVKGGTFSENRQWLPIEVDCLCVHSDTENALALVVALKKYLDKL